jgi:hypothetical protein
LSPGCARQGRAVIGNDAVECSGASRALGQAERAAVVG